MASRVASHNGDFSRFFSTVSARGHDLTPGGGLGVATPRNHPEPRGQIDHGTIDERRQIASWRDGSQPWPRAGEGCRRRAAGTRDHDGCAVIDRVRSCATCDLPLALDTERRRRLVASGRRAYNAAIMRAWVPAALINSGGICPRLCGGGGGAHRASDERSRGATKGSDDLSADAGSA